MPLDALQEIRNNVSDEWYVGNDTTIQLLEHDYEEAKKAAATFHETTALRDLATLYYHLGAFNGVTALICSVEHIGFIIINYNQAGGIDTFVDDIRSSEATAGEIK